MRDVRFGDDSCCDDPPLSDEVAAGRVAAPPGFMGGYGSFYQRGEIRADAHDRRAGVRGGVHGEHGDRWLRYGANASGWWDVTGHGRVLSLWVMVELTHGDAVPFTEQAQVRRRRHSPASRRDGWSAPARRRRPCATTGRCGPGSSGRSSSRRATSTAPTSPASIPGWPASRPASACARWASGPDKDNQLEILTAVGSEPFDDGAALSSFRLVVGVVHAF